MSEDFLNFIWKYRLFDMSGLTTESGEQLKIINTGTYNTNAGPDFSNVRILINETLWVGNAEIHIRSSDWNRHGHQNDPAYNNVILHVVYYDDINIARHDKTCPHTLKLSERIDMNRYNNYRDLVSDLSVFPCGKSLVKLDPLYLNNQLARSLADRLEEKSENFSELVDEFKGSWEDAFYVACARNFGFKVNELPFELLARSLPLHLLNKHRDNYLQVEALLFGQAGMLDKPLDGYSRLLADEYRFLRKKYALKPLDAAMWKFLRLRPGNFPSLRLAQFAALINRYDRLFSQMLSIKEKRELFKFYANVSASAYWNSHYRLGVATYKHSCRLGKDAIANIYINTVVTTLFCYGRFIGKADFCDKAVSMLESFPPEDNQIVRSYRDAGMDIANAAESQGVLQLKRCLCDRKKCLLCIIGMKIVKAD